MPVPSLSQTVLNNSPIMLAQVIFSIINEFPVALLTRDANCQKFFTRANKPNSNFSTCFTASIPVHCSSKSFLIMETFLLIFNSNIDNNTSIRIIVDNDSPFMSSFNIFSHKLFNLSSSISFVGSLMNKSSLNLNLESYISNYFDIENELIQKVFINIYLRFHFYLKISFSRSKK